MLARNFVLDPLIYSQNEEHRSLGVAMGSCIMARVLGIDLEALSGDDFCQEKISQAMVKYLIDA
jgi:hypothetical protein